MWVFSKDAIFLNMTHLKKYLSYTDSNYAVEFGWFRFVTCIVTFWLILMRLNVPIGMTNTDRLGKSDLTYVA
jgi:hypothetical protein